MVSPNGAGFWDFKTFPKLQTIQNKAIRHVMGVGKYCPVDLLEGVPVPCRHQIEMLCLATMDDSRLILKKIKWSLAVANKGKSSWCFHVKKLLIIHIDLGHLNSENVM